MATNELKLKWPFYMYRILMPEEKDIDAYQWLYISLIIATNNMLGHSKGSYQKETIDYVSKFIIKNFGDVIDSDMLEQIRIRSEKHFIVSGTIKESELESFENDESIFSSNKELFYIFQDRITGEVMPYFFERMEFIKKDIRNCKEDNVKNVSCSESELSLNDEAVLRAYETSLRIHKKLDILKYGTEMVSKSDESTNTIYSTNNVSPTVFNTTSDIEQNDIEQETDVESCETMEDPVGDETSSTDITKHYVHFIGSSVEYSLLIRIYLRDGELFAVSPFEHTYTDEWMLSCLRKGMQLSDELNGYCQPLISELPVSNRYAELVESVKEKDYRDTFKSCSSVYDIIEKMGYEELYDSVIRLELEYNRSDTSFFIDLVKIIEFMLRKVKYDVTPAYVRRNIDFDTFCARLETKISKTKLDYSGLMNRGIYANWKKTTGPSPPCLEMKPLIADIFMNTDYSKSKFMIPTFVEKAFKLYNYRNTQAHDEDSQRILRKAMNQKLIEEATEVLNVISNFKRI